MSNPKKRNNINGVVLLDKPEGITSNSALQQVRKIFNAAKAGHTGSLDPLATGLLPICFGQATKFAGYMLDSDKAYVVTAKLGAMTSTGDSDGEVESTSAIPKFTNDNLLDIASKFIGEIEQTPPKYSALKYKGKPLYYWARKGIEVPDKRRKINIFEVNIISYTQDSIDMYVRCSKGTYIRSFVEDFAVKLGTCAHVSMLRRVKLDKFKVEDAKTIEEIESIAARGELEQLLLKPASLVDNFYKANLTEQEAKAFCFGQKQITSAPITSVATNDIITVWGPSSSFLGLGYKDSYGNLCPKKLIAQAN